jgi:hypothetical protein
MADVYSPSRGFERREASFLLLCRITSQDSSLQARLLEATNRETTKHCLFPQKAITIDARVKTVQAKIRLSVSPSTSRHPDPSITLTPSKTGDILYRPPRRAGMVPVPFIFEISTKLGELRGDGDRAFLMPITRRSATSNKLEHSTIST